MSYKRLLVVLIALSISCSATITVIQHSHAESINNGSTVTCTLSATGASRNIIVGAVHTLHEAVWVASVTDNKGNIYVQPPGNALGPNNWELPGAHGGVFATEFSEIWHSLGTSAGVTSVTITFNMPLPQIVPVPMVFSKACFAYEIDGAGMTFDAYASQLSPFSPPCVVNLCTGASVSTNANVGFVLGIIVVAGYSSVPLRLVDQSPANGNEFTAGSEIALGGITAAASLISSTAAAHQPAWHIDTVPGFLASSVAAYRQ
jgi:hypothetical protein